MESDPAASAGDGDHRLSRRSLIGAGLSAAAASFAAPHLARGAAPTRPNILCLVSEDCGAYHLPAYGGQATTPHIDALAAAGVRWERCFSAAPVCAPSRAAMITGLAPESCGPAHQMRAEGRPPAALQGRGWPALLREAGYYCTNNVKTDYNLPVDMDATWDASSPVAHWRDRPAGTPFLAIFNPQFTHEIAVATATPADVLLDGVVETPYVPLHAVTAYVGTPVVGGPTSADEVRIPPYLQDTQTTRADAAHYLNCIHQMDAELGARLAELEAAGLADDTIVLYYSDHAGALPRSKRFCYDSGLHIPLVARFGRNVAHLAPGPPGSVVESPVNSGTDLPVTILGLAGVEARPRLPGVAFAGPRRCRRAYAFSMRNRMDERYDMQRTVRDRDYRYVRNYMPHVPYGQHIQFMWLQAGYREWEQHHRDGRLDHVQDRFWKPKPAEELYLVATDPDEIENLASHPDHSAAIKRLRRVLDRHLLAIGDNGFIPEGSSSEGWDASRRPGAYPLKRVLRTAAKAIEREPDNVPFLVDHLADPNYVVRYWAALGCCMLGPVPAAGAAPALHDVFEHDPSVHVRIAAAEALAHQDVGDAVTFLGDRLLADPVYPVRLYAANALENIGKRALPALPQLLRAAVSLGDVGDAGEPYVAQAARHTALTLLGITAPLP